MKNLTLWIILGVIIGITCTACSVAKEHIVASPFTNVFTDRYFVNTTKVKTEEGTYRIFTIENRNGNQGGAGITAVLIK